MSKSVLITGGAGFIGTNLTRRLLREGYSVALIDNFNKQVHADNQDLAPDLMDHVELHRGDVRNRELLSRLLSNRDVIVHFAAETGTGQSMYEVLRYEDVNLGGTATLIDCIVNNRSCRASKIILASSRAIYGEGKYQCKAHNTVYPYSRNVVDLEAGLYEPRCPICKSACTSVATSEDSPPHPLSFYGLTKKVQEEMVLMFAEACGLSAYVLRYQNVFGPGQSLRNPYTGILSIFSSLARSNSPIQIFEDGRESRDFVFVEDVVEATWRCIEKDSKEAVVLNVGTGQRTTVLDVAKQIVAFFKSKTQITITGAFRQGDIRHNFADLTKIREKIGFAPRFTFHTGLSTFLNWVETQELIVPKYELSLTEMRDRGFLHGQP